MNNLPYADYSGLTRKPQAYMHTMKETTPQKAKLGMKDIIAGLFSLGVLTIIGLGALIVATATVTATAVLVVDLIG